MQFVYIAYMRNVLYANEMTKCIRYRCIQYKVPRSPQHQPYSFPFSKHAIHMEFSVEFCWNPPRMDSFRKYRWHGISLSMSFSKHISHNCLLYENTVPGLCQKEAGRRQHSTSHIAVSWQVTCSRLEWYPDYVITLIIYTILLENLALSVMWFIMSTCRGKTSHGNLSVMHFWRTF